MSWEKYRQTFESKVPLIKATMGRHRGLIRACRLEAEDVYQELSIRLWEALGKYDPEKCSNLDAYLMLQLRYRLFDMRSASKRYGIPHAPRKNFFVISLDAPDRFGNYLEVPATIASGNPGWIELEIDRLPHQQQLALNRYLSGRKVRTTNKHLLAARCRFRQLEQERREREAA